VVQPGEPQAPAQYAHLHCMQLPLVAGGCRPALAAVQCHWPHQRPVDLRLESNGHATVAQDAGDLAPLEPGSFDAGADFERDVTVDADGRAEVLKVLHLELCGAYVNSSIGLCAALQVFRLGRVNFQAVKGLGGRSTTASVLAVGDMKRWLGRRRP